MTERRYYTDAYTSAFTATVVERLRAENHDAVVLDRTLFYPTSGGQPHDIGTIAGTAVVDVTIRPRDGAIIHHLLGEFWATGQVNCQIDWVRRFDHMQQHTGQHILSQAFIQAADAETVGFHLSDEYATIDLDRQDLTPAQVQQAETIANQIIWDDRAVKVELVTAAKAARLPLRKIPPADRGRLRIIEIDGFDWSACGGTHVARTGEIGLIKIVKLERRNQKLRLTFLCGSRALADYRDKNRIVSRLMTQFTTGQDEIEPAVERLQTETAAQRRELRALLGELAQTRAQLLAAAATRHGDTAIVTHAVNDKDYDYLRALAAELTGDPHTVALLGLAGDNARLLFTRGSEAQGDMNELLRSALQVLGTTAGGGNAIQAQGGGAPGDLDRVRSALARAERNLLAKLGRPSAR